jgi:hypothetical protein
VSANRSVGHLRCRHIAGWSDTAVDDATRNQTAPVLSLCPRETQHQKGAALTYIAGRAARRQISSAGTGTPPTGRSRRHLPKTTHAHRPPKPPPNLRWPAPPEPTRSFALQTSSRSAIPITLRSPRTNNRTKRPIRVLHRPNAIHGPTPKKASGTLAQRCNTDFGRAEDALESAGAPSAPAIRTRSPRPRPRAVSSVPETPPPQPKRGRRP